MQLLDGLDVVHIAHVGQQDDHVQRAVVACATEQGNRGYVETGHSPPGPASAEHAAKGDVTAGLEMGRGLHPEDQCRQDVLVRPGARRAHFSRGIFNGPSGPVGGNGRLESCGFIRGEPVDGLGGGQVGGNGRLESCGFIRCCRPRFAWAGLGQSSLLESALRSVSSLRPRCSATSLRLQPSSATVVLGR